MSMLLLHRAALSAATLVLLAACSSEAARTDSAVADSGAAPATMSGPPARAAELTGVSDSSAAGMTTVAFSTPESVRYDSSANAYFVSNIVGNPSMKDGKAFIAMVGADAPFAGRMLVMGGRNGAVLNAPKGMVLVGDTLWVTDIDVVRAFDKRTGAPIATVNLAPMRATFLNDIAVGPDGALYITDTGIRFDAQGGMTHPGTDRIFRIVGRTASVAASGPALGAPNGIAWDGARSRFIVVGFNSADVMTWAPGDTMPMKLVSGPGQYDGVEVLADGRILVSSWADSSVNVVRDSTLTRLVGGLDAPADIGVNTRAMHLAVPRFTANRVELFPIPAR